MEKQPIDALIRDLMFECVGVKTLDPRLLQRSDPALAVIVECIREGLISRGLFSNRIGHNKTLIYNLINNHEPLVKALKTCVVALQAAGLLFDASGVIANKVNGAIKEAEAVLGQLEGK